MQNDFASFVGLMVKAGYAKIAHYAVKRGLDCDTSLVFHNRMKSIVVEFRLTEGSLDFWTVIVAIRTVAGCPTIVLDRFGAGETILKRDKEGCEVVYRKFYERADGTTVRAQRMLESFVNATRNLETLGGKFDSLDVSFFMDRDKFGSLAEQEFVRGFDMLYLRSFVRYVAGIDYKRLYPPKVKA